MHSIESIFKKTVLSHEDIVYLLGLQDSEKARLIEYAAQIKQKYVGNRVYFRGLIEFSNRCMKNCLYCGIRHENKTIIRYNLTDNEIIAAACYAFENNFGSLILQSGELESRNFITKVGRILQEIHRITNNRLRITLSCGEQDEKTYRYWFECGAHRYLLRIESSNPELYNKLHPQDGRHSYDRRYNCLCNLQQIGYQVGTGVMIGLPFQTMDDLASDLLFMKRFNIDMVGMGPYLEHDHTPLYAFHHQLLPQEERLQLTLKMISVLRIMMKDINIAATTALQVTDKSGREKAIKAGANVIMPNITPLKYRVNYLLYRNKPGIEESLVDCNANMKTIIDFTNNEIAFGEWGDSRHFKRRVTRDQRQGTNE
jgi:biotin synthase